MSVIHLAENDFNKTILEDKKTAMIDFWATWCGPCRMLGPFIEELGNELENEILVGKVDVDQCPSIAEKYGVMSIPTIIYFKDGMEVKRLIGFQPKDLLKKEAQSI